MTQAALAAHSGVSLASIQNTERGTANPSLSVLNRLLSALGHELSIVPVRPDWDLLATCGLPLAARAMPVRPSLPLLSHLLRLACLDLLHTNHERKRVAVEALLMAIRFSYPSTFARHFTNGLFDRFWPHFASGKHLKLQRLAEPILATYL